MVPHILPKSHLINLQSHRSRGCAPLAHTDGRTGEHVDNHRPLSHRGNTTNTRCHFPVPVPLTVLQCKYVMMCVRTRCESDAWAVAGVLGAA